MLSKPAPGSHREVDKINTSPILIGTILIYSYRNHFNIIFPSIATLFLNFSFHTNGTKNKARNIDLSDFYTVEYNEFIRTFRKIFETFTKTN